MFINESFLSFVWQYSYFDLSALSTVDGQRLEILSPGNPNLHAGPDFSEARIRIDGILWMGAVEIHVRSSHWHLHQHQLNHSYNQVILHLVWKDDHPVIRPDGSRIPTLELFPRVSARLIYRFRSLVYVPGGKIACQDQLDHVAGIKILAMIQKTLVRRLERKSFVIDHLLKECGNNWEEVAYRWIVRNFGFKVNQENMYLLSKFLPLKLILRHRNDLERLEALLFGMAGFLQQKKDDYQRKLSEDYEFLKHKYQFRSDFLQRYQWKFLRLHPQNFPTIRISQVAMLLTRISNLFSYVIHAGTVKEIYRDFQICQSSYWQNHYDFGEPSKRPVAGLGKSSIDNLVINGFVPIMISYGRFSDQEIYQEKGLSILEKIDPENNRITRNWEKLGIRAKNAADSQGLIELYNQFCYKKQCLNCNIGAEILLHLK
jgi:hypothetical protein